MSATPDVQATKEFMAFEANNCELGEELRLMPNEIGGRRPGGGDDWSGDRDRQLYRLAAQVEALGNQLDRIERATEQWRRDYDERADKRFRDYDERFNRMDERFGRFVSKEELSQQFRPVNWAFSATGQIVVTLLIAGALAMIGWIVSSGP